MYKYRKVGDILCMMMNIYNCAKTQNNSDNSGTSAITPYQTKIFYSQTKITNIFYSHTILDNCAILMIWQ